MTPFGANVVDESGVWPSELSFDCGALRFDIVMLAAAGRNRREHGDAHLAHPENRAFAVADGVSTLPNGGATARRSLKDLNIELAAAAAFDIASTRAAIERVNRRIFAAAVAKGRGEKLGACILTGFRIWPGADGLTFFQVGDGAFYLSDGPGADFELMAEPQKIFRASKLDPDRMLGRLKTAIGARPTIDPIVGEVPIGPEGAFALVTDGLDDLASLTAAPWFKGGPEVEELAERVRAQAAIASDDLTVLAGRWRAASG